MSIYPFGGATVKLVQQIGYVHAMDLLLTGRLVSADFAAGIGLVNRVLPARRMVLRRHSSWRAQIAANSPSAVQAVKTQISASIADFALSREALEQQLGDSVRASPAFRRRSGGVPREETAQLCLMSSIWRALSGPATACMVCRGRRARRAAGAARSAARPRATGVRAAQLSPDQLDRCGAPCRAHAGHRARRRRNQSALPGRSARSMCCRPTTR